MDAGGAGAEDPVVGEELSGRASMGGEAGVVLGRLLGQMDMKGARRSSAQRDTVAN